MRIKEYGTLPATALAIATAIAALPTVAEAQHQRHGAVNLHATRHFHGRHFGLGTGFRITERPTTTTDTISTASAIRHSTMRGMWTSTITVLTLIRLDLLLQRRTYLGVRKARPLPSAQCAASAEERTYKLIEARCPLILQKRTLIGVTWMSALGQ
jgi:hypothetical protein